VVEHVRRAREKGFAVAIVVSAMGRRGDPYATDTLLGWLTSDGTPADPRDYDLIFTTGEAISAAVMAHSLRAAGIPAVAMTSAQAGIYTDGHHQEAEILTIDPAHMVAAMVRGEVPVITGAQGVALGTLEYTTLGRGGSDTSGVAVGAALHADLVEIFSDVEGIAIADPRVVPGARFLRQISFDSMYELARFGATVMHPRAIAAARDGKVRLVVRSTFSDGPGTLIADVPDEEPITGVAVMPSMLTAVLDSADVAPASRLAWEREGLLSLIDRVSGALIVGTKARTLEDVRAMVTGAGRRIEGVAEDRAWVSVVGDPAALAESPVGDSRALTELGIEVKWAETTPRRRTYVVPDGARDYAVRGLYSLASGRTVAAVDERPAMQSEGRR
jgi:aspartokinase